VRLFADEDVPLPSIVALRNAGHDTEAARELFPGAPDRVVLSRAAVEQRVLITFDRHFGELVYKQQQPAPPAILYIRFRPSSPLEPSDVLLAIFAQAEIRLDGFLTVVERDRVRQRRLPDGAG
jgi:predicted nuclease of predicted toxin-antitoxin system